MVPSIPWPLYWKQFPVILILGFSRIAGPFSAVSKPSSYGGLLSIPFSVALAPKDDPSHAAALLNSNDLKVQKTEECLHY